MLGLGLGWLQEVISGFQPVSDLLWLAWIYPFSLPPGVVHRTTLISFVPEPFLPPAPFNVAD